MRTYVCTHARACVRTYVHTNACMYVPIRAYIHTHIRMHTCTYVYLCVRACVCTHARMHICIDGWMDGWMDGCTHACMHACMNQCKDACMHVCMYAHIAYLYTRRVCIRRGGFRILLCQSLVKDPSDRRHASSLLVLLSRLGCAVCPM